VNLLEKQLSTVYFKDVRLPWVTLYEKQVQVTLIYLWSDSSRRTWTHTVDKKKSLETCAVYSTPVNSHVCTCTQTHTPTNYKWEYLAHYCAKHPLVEGPCFTL